MGFTSMPRPGWIALFVVVALAAGVALLGPCARSEIDGVTIATKPPAAAVADAAKARRREAASGEAESSPGVDPKSPIDARATVVVRVTAAEDKTPIAGADVELVRDDDAPARRFQATTDAAGAARFEVEAGAVTVHAIAAERVASELWSETATTDRETAIDIALERGVVLDGIVLDAANGRPIEGARVEVVRGGHVGGFGMTGSDTPPLGRVVTIGDGRFRVRVPANEIVTATASARLFVDGSRAVVASDGDAPRPPVVLRLEASGALRGTVRDPDGKPVPDAKVDLLPAHVAGMLLDDPEQWVDQGGRRWTALVGTTDAAGRYEIGGLDRGGKYVAFAKGDGWAPSEKREKVFVSDDRSVAEADFALRRFGGIDVHVVDSAGKPLEAKVTIFGENTRPADDADAVAGRLTLESVAPGSYDVMATSVGKPVATVPIAVPGGSLVEVIARVTDGVEFAGVVVDDAGAPVSNARVRVDSTEHDSTSFVDVRTDERGAFRGAARSAGPHRVSVWHPERSLWISSIPFDAPVSDLHLVFPRLTHVTLRLVPPPGGTSWIRLVSWLADVTGDVSWGGGDLGQSALVGISGRMVTFWVVPGRCNVRAQFEEYAPLTFDFESAPGQELDLGDVPLSLGLDLVGRVEDVHGTPIPGALVTIGEMYSLGHRDATSGSDGGFRLPRLASGKVGVTVLAPDFVRTYVEAYVAPETVPLVVRLIRGGLVRVTVVDAAGASVVGASVCLGDFGGDTDHRGVCVLRVPAGRQCATVQDRDGSADVEVVDGGETAIRLVVR